SIKAPAVTFFAIQSIVVVTSPIGDHAPPAFVAITTSAAYQILSSLLWISFLKSVINTIVAVRLSIIAESKKPIIPIVHNNFRLLLVLTTLLSTSKPRCKSIISTIVIAPIKKIRISAVLPKWWSKVPSNPSIAVSPPDKKLNACSSLFITSNQPLVKPIAKTAQIKDAIISAGTVLSNFKGCSKVMERYPITKIKMIIDAMIL